MKIIFKAFYCYANNFIYEKGLISLRDVALTYTGRLLGTSEIGQNEALAESENLRGNLQKM